MNKYLVANSCTGMHLEDQNNSIWKQRRAFTTYCCSGSFDRIYGAICFSCTNRTKYTVSCLHQHVSNNKYPSINNLLYQRYFCQFIKWYCNTHFFISRFTTVLKTYTVILLSYFPFILSFAYRLYMNVILYSNFS